MAHLRRQKAPNSRLPRIAHTAVDDGLFKAYPTRFLASRHCPQDVDGPVKEVRRGEDLGMRAVRAPESLQWSSVV
jgi:hypothetical protein